MRVIFRWQLPSAAPPVHQGPALPLTTLPAPKLIAQPNTAPLSSIGRTMPVPEAVARQAVVIPAAQLPPRFSAPHFSSRIQCRTRPDAITCKTVVAAHHQLRETLQRRKRKARTFAGSPFLTGISVASYGFRLLKVKSKLSIFSDHFNFSYILHLAIIRVATVCLAEP